MILDDKLYDTLKYIGTVVMPHLAVLITTIGSALNIPYTREIGIVITAIGVFMKDVTDYSSSNYYKKKVSDDIEETISEHNDDQDVIE